MLGAPVGGINGGVAEEGEKRRGFGREMGGEALDGRHRGSRGGEEVEDVFEQLAAGDGEPARGHLASSIAIAQRQRLLESLLDLRGEGTPRVIGLKQPTPAQQMRETRLMMGVHEAPIGRPHAAKHRAGPWVYLPR